MRSVLITGGTGFVGSALCDFLVKKRWQIWVLTRQRNLTAQSFDGLTYIAQLSDIPEDHQLTAIVNLAGEALNSHRWNTQQKQRIVDSRVQMTQRIADWLKHQQRTVDVWINGSAIGWYGPHQDQRLTESSRSVDSFSHRLCEQWENTAIAAKQCCQRLILMRTGIVLDASGGPLKEMLLPYQLCMGGRMGDGQQYWSWIHRQDIVRLIADMLERDCYNGIVNATAPEPVKQAVFAKTLAAIMGRPCFANMPAWMCRMSLGEFATEILCKGQRVIPEQALQHGFEFSYPFLAQALQASLNKK